MINLASWLGTGHKSRRTLTELILGLMKSEFRKFEFLATSV